MIARLGRANDFRRLGREGRRVRSGPVKVVALIDPALGDCRVAYSIRRAHGPAVARNRTRRRLRAVCQQLDRQGRIPTGWFLISPRDDAASTTSSEWFSALEGVFDGLTPQ